MENITKNSSIKIIGITGGIGSGKTAFAKFLRELGQNVVDSDQLARKAVEDPDILSVISSHFGDFVFDNGKLDRKKLGSVVFNNSAELEFLEDLLHPLILNLLKEEISLENFPLFYEAPLLFDAKHNELMDLTIVVISDKSVRSQRVITRDNLSENEIELRMENQHSSFWYESRADIVVNNQGNLSELRQKAMDFLQDLKTNNYPKSIY